MKNDLGLLAFSRDDEGDLVVSFGRFAINVHGPDCWTLWHNGNIVLLGDDKDIRNGISEFLEDGNKFLEELKAFFPINDSDSLTYEI